ncbi:MAG: hypothetical protein P8N56_03055 [Schleiferiaceae bacterium]|nr:hypothetical protein [Schleiferiaceae bacterium]
MKHFLYSVAILLTLSPQVLAQEQSRNKEFEASKRDRIEAAKIAFITKEAELSSEEAKIFWPLYEAYHAELRSIDKDPMVKIRKDQSKPARLTNEEALSILKAMEEMAEKREAIRKKYQKKFLAVLPAYKVLAYYHAEREFQRRLNDRLRESRPNGGTQNSRPNGPPPGGRRPAGPPPPSGMLF